jgi:hypothetical protein
MAAATILDYRKISHLTQVVNTSSYQVYAGAFQVRSTQRPGIITSDFDEIWQGARTHVETVKTKFLDFLFDRCPRYGSLNFTQNGPTYSDRATVKQL